MSNFLGGAPARPRLEPDLARTLQMLATLFVAALAVTTLYVGREIFIPIAIAIPVSFVLAPPVLLLRRWGLGRVPSVLTVVLTALAIAFLVSAVLTRQVSELAVDLPKYQATVGAKIVKLRDAAADNALFAKVSAALKNLGEINPHRPAPSSAPAPSDQPKNQLTKGQENQPPVPVEVRQPAWGPFAIVETIAGTALSSLETTVVVVIFVIFILLQREDLRNRFIRLAGSRDLHRTTIAMNDAAGRLSRFFLVQTLVNTSFGVIVATGLYLIGLPSPILWGVVAFLLRFVPYFGPLIAAGFPMALAAAIDPGWGMALETLALFLLVESVQRPLVTRPHQGPFHRNAARSPGSARRDPRRMPVHAHHGAEGLKPEGIREPAQQLVTSVVVDNGLRHHGAKARHPVGKPPWNKAPVQRQIGASGPSCQPFQVLEDFGSTSSPFLLCTTHGESG